MRENSSLPLRMWRFLRMNMMPIHEAEEIAIQAGNATVFTKEQS